MAYTPNNPVLAAELIALKAKVKAEVQRRNQSGSVSSFAGAAYDYNSGDSPAAGQPLHRDAYNKINTPARAVNGSGIPGDISAGDTLPALGDVNTKVSAWQTRSMTDRTASDCASGCTGTCHTGCATGCYTGCTDACSGCGSGCAYGCSGCGSGCAGGCTGCGSGCAGGCTGCGGACSSGCGGACSFGCEISCTGSGAPDW